MSLKQQQFHIGDVVSEKTFVETKRIGHVLKVYVYDGERRLVVKFSDGSESVFLESELVTELV